MLRRSAGKESKEFLDQCIQGGPPSVKAAPKSSQSPRILLACFQVMLDAVAAGVTLASNRASKGVKVWQSTKGEY